VLTTTYALYNVPNDELQRTMPSISDGEWSDDEYELQRPVPFVSDDELQSKDGRSMELRSIWAPSISGIERSNCLCGGRSLRFLVAV
jgi:hypothetical protein